ncbi:MAG: DUF805 domain-containing protein [Hyphomicrobiaceae bacterium]|nr:DUF805 domain-containing protein [Hyphomicrobiaceae bacterium]
MTVVRWLFDPRGRADRRGLLWLAIVLLALQGALFGILFSGLTMDRIGIVTPLLVAAKLLILWVSIVAVIKRLHDVGLSGIWMLVGFGGWSLFTTIVAAGMLMVVGLDAMRPTSAHYWTTMGLSMLPVVVLMMWLHLAPGERRPNRFGVPPGPSGFGPAPSFGWGRQQLAVPMAA